MTADDWRTSQPHVSDRAMSDIQRYYADKPNEIMWKGDEGEWVLHDDHVAALAAQATAHEAALAEAKDRAARILTEHSLVQYEQGVSDERARIRAGVKALSHDRLTWKAAVLAIIDGEAS